VLAERTFSWKLKNLQNYYESLFGFLDRHIGKPAASQAELKPTPQVATSGDTTPR
jgi:hypothetical protein